MKLFGFKHIKINVKCVQILFIFGNYTFQNVCTPNFEIIFSRVRFQWFEYFRLFSCRCNVFPFLLSFHEWLEFFEVPQNWTDSLRTVFFFYAIKPFSAGQCLVHEKKTNQIQYFPWLSNNVNCIKYKLSKFSVSASFRMSSLLDFSILTSVSESAE